MPYQNISAEITQATFDQIVVKLNEIKALLPFLINLTPEERQSLPKMGNDKLPFVTKSLTYGQQFPQIVPPFTSLAELQKDPALTARVLQLLQIFRPFTQSLDDTGMAVGSESYVAGLSIYNSAGQAAKVNFPGATEIHADLKTHFEHNGGGAPTPAPAPNP
ncbi:MAG: hypothetical protein FD161_1224 [Limisphaerales bacterium]|nr:MAG: hypothetical protein FD161_1224 [Limisphaerales bacterium]TXT49494.1 MAG: hypothetical protein FD140_3026 [Limisphaerales bacterium]